jgi:hypothetical protein
MQIQRTQRDEPCSRSFNILQGNKIRAQRLRPVKWLTHHLARSGTRRARSPSKGPSPPAACPGRRPDRIASSGGSLLPEDPGEEAAGPLVGRALIPLRSAENAPRIAVPGGKVLRERSEDIDRFGENIAARGWSARRRERRFQREVAVRPGRQSDDKSDSSQPQDMPIKRYEPDSIIIQRSGARNGKSRLQGPRAGAAPQRSRQQPR